MLEKLWWEQNLDIVSENLQFSEKLLSFKKSHKQWYIFTGGDVYDTMRTFLIGQVNLIRTSKEANPKEMLEELRNGEEEGEEIQKR